ncbi:MAG: tRNA preQ1(34) S-adenosylmethionine ribosyltransferase-isomerase QueA, partial [Desulfobacterales bacterium]|nr:tRNA preQ1(34) S-adenosylmethionine ribosyltransferase-isomerase QueA [Desulfobacterales bacterium]
MFLLGDYDYELPGELIAQTPAGRRDGSRLLCLDRGAGGLSHHEFKDVGDLLRPDDLLVVNNTEVIPGRLPGKKDTGGKAEILILDYARGQTASNGEKGRVHQCLVKASKPPRPGAFIHFEKGLKAEVLDHREGVCSLKFHCNGNFEALLDEIGKTPLPPYIRRGEEDPALNDRANYQTVYASQKGAIAAPTAGLHFTGDLIDGLKSRGTEMVELTLHVGYGTFSPVRVDDIREHRIHTEWFSISRSAADRINGAKAQGRRIVAVGTTSVRTLEHATTKYGLVEMGAGSCGLFIYPGYRFKVVDAMITNFHLPKSTLLMLVSAFAGIEN